MDFGDQQVRQSGPKCFRCPEPGGQIRGTSCRCGISANYIAQNAIAVIVKSLIGVENGLAHFGPLRSIFHRCVSRLGPLGNTGWVFASKRTTSRK